VIQTGLDTRYTDLFLNLWQSSPVRVKELFVVNLKGILWTYSFFLSQGMIKVALYLKKKLEGGILEKAFNSDPVRNFVDC